ncbi:MAG: hypothetical protein WB999_11560 [Candidatus Binataceae bacterium]
MTSKSLKLTMLGLVAVCVAGIYSAISFAQASTSPMAEPTTAQAPFEKKSGTWHKYRKEDVQAVMTKVAQDVWHAQYSGASGQHMEQLFLEGQRAYFHGDYDGAMHDFVATERIVSKYPNDVTAGARPAP